MRNDHKGDTATEVVGTSECRNNSKRTQTIHRRCLIYKGLPCAGNRQYQSDRVICTECAPAGIALESLPESAQQQVLQEALYA